MVDVLIYILDKAHNKVIVKPPYEVRGLDCSIQLGYKLIIKVNPFAPLLWRVRPDSEGFFVRRMK